MYRGADPLAIDLLHGLLKFDPAKRLTAQQALEHPYLKRIRDDVAITVQNFFVCLFSLLSFSFSSLFSLLSSLLSSLFSSLFSSPSLFSLSSFSSIFYFDLLLPSFSSSALSFSFSSSSSLLLFLFSFFSFS